MGRHFPGRSGLPVLCAGLEADFLPGRTQVKSYRRKDTTGLSARMLAIWVSSVSGSGALAAMEADGRCRTETVLLQYILRRLCDHTEPCDTTTPAVRLILGCVLDGGGQR